MKTTFLNASFNQNKLAAAAAAQPSFKPSVKPVAAAPNSNAISIGGTMPTVPTVPTVPNVSTLGIDNALANRTQEEADKVAAELKAQQEMGNHTTDVLKSNETKLNAKMGI